MLRADLIAWTEADYNAMREATDGRWQVPHDGHTSAEGLLVFGGRACYQSWEMPNPATATAQGYLGNILSQGHGSVFEHSSATFYLQGVSRDFTHQLIRHRHMSYGQLSQRYVDESRAKFVIHPTLRGMDELEGMTMSFLAITSSAYKVVVETLEKRGHTRKAAREAARTFLPGGTETKIVITANFRAWRHFIAMRATEHADREICEVALAVGRILKDKFPHTFQDLEFTEGGEAVFGHDLGERGMV